MKKTLLTSVLTLSLTAAIANAAETPPQTTPSAASTADGATWVPASKSAAPQIAPRIAGEATSVTQITPLLAPDFLSDQWPAAGNAIVGDATNGTLGASSLYVVPGSIAWNNLAANTTNTQELKFELDIRAVSHTDSISLSKEVVTFASSDGGALNGSLYFTNASYTMRAIGIKANGDQINSGDASQLCERVIVIVSSKLFAANSQAALDSIKQWFVNHDSTNSPYTVTCTAGTDGNSMSSRSISSIPRGQFHTDFTSGIAGDSSNVYVWINGGDADANYTIEATDVLNPPNWTPVSAIHGFDHTTNSMDGHPMRYFRAMLQQ